MLETAREALALYDPRVLLAEPTLPSTADAAELTLLRLGDGLINETFLVGSSLIPRLSAVLQRVSPLFSRAVHEDIEAITGHLALRGLPTPRLVRSAADTLSVELPAGQGVWRVLTFIPGVSHSRLVLPLAAEAGSLVGRFHAALVDLQHTFRSVRKGAHDLAGHVARLEQALRSAQTPGFVGPESPIPAGFVPLAHALLGQADGLRLATTDVGRLPLRICHGDLKINNLRFDEAGRGLCLLDLDTLAELPLAFELGDALRSWCNPAGEDIPAATFSLDLLAAALRGYGAQIGGMLHPMEQETLIAGIERITFQLAVRFAADVVAQSYFRYNASRFASRAEHNLLRAQGQWTLFQSLVAQRGEAEAAVRQAWSRLPG